MRCSSAHATGCAEAADRTARHAPEEPALRKVYTAESLIEVQHLRNVLESAGIACVVRNDRLGGIVGEIPFVECWPELWVVESGYALLAKTLIDEARGAAKNHGEAWTCPRCGERIEPQFSECWRCAGPQNTDES